MSKGTFAKEDVVEDYLTSLLTEEVEEDREQLESVAKLLATADVAAVQESLEEPTFCEPNPLPEIKETSVLVENKESSSVKAKEVEASFIPTKDFQALFFEVAGLTLALPLTELGGIHKIQKVGPLFGKPKWFKGVMLHRDEKLSVVDTALWVMPEKYNDELAESLNYQYLIMLDSSGWGLACERLITTSTLAPTDVKWRKANNKRPWLAGMVKDKMCALVNVKQLIKLLDKGQNSNDK
ncbi:MULTISPECIES: chemotaxis protein CheW [Alteromonadaceae]|uniref:chemotaxis protein CheW n=1 Tax=Alteromonadaceae TaxID=72275 RepID=UPI001C088B6A|nr:MULTISPECIES: chemotaxis protein CheW [Aliiglaciecola]MBU2879811.1 chemotaxis protein CheW [Aliiglaciecola lipolytica]MDO6709910.1 chemotaxis protein CheW [Aliiglaciecola sp. 2_MG-2023]MDO6751058.1 chemotaxis protein CheW [Aliiglaciecola sp. 1_MG-2023]